MTINFQKFKEKLEASKTKKTSSTQYNWMKLDSGKRYTMRFLPLKSENLELPIAIYNHHALTFPDGHFESVACPKKTEDRDCPFCDLASKTYRKYVKTENREFLEAAKTLFVKTHYLLVGYEPSEIDETEIKSEDLKIWRASSVANKEFIESKLEREIDFVDFQTGRDVDIRKTKPSGKGQFPTIAIEFNDPAPAFSGKKGKETWDALLDASPDLTPFVTPLNDDELAKKFKDFTSTPVESEEISDDDEQERELLTKYKAKVKQTTVSNNDALTDLPFDIEDLKASMED